jgi:hypothetical protein
MEAAALPRTDPTGSTVAVIVLGDPIIETTTEDSR